MHATVVDGNFQLDAGGGCRWRLLARPARRRATTSQIPLARGLTVSVLLGRTIHSNSGNHLSGSPGDPRPVSVAAKLTHAGKRVVRGTATMLKTSGNWDSRPEPWCHWPIGRSGREPLEECGIRCRDVAPVEAQRLEGGDVRHVTPLL